MKTAIGRTGTYEKLCPPYLTDPRQQYSAVRMDKQALIGQAGQAVYKGGQAGPHQACKSSTKGKSSTKAGRPG